TLPLFTYTTLFRSGVLALTERDRARLGVDDRTDGSGPGVVGPVVHPHHDTTECDEHDDDGDGDSDGEPVGLLSCLSACHCIPICLRPAAVRRVLLPLRILCPGAAMPAV